jgi:hypothetical protein
MSNKKQTRKMDVQLALKEKNGQQLTHAVFDRSHHMARKKGQMVFKKQTFFGIFSSNKSKKH